MHRVLCYTSVRKLLNNCIVIHDEPCVYVLQLNVAHKLKSRLKLEHCPTFSETIELSFATGPKSLQKHAELFRYVYTNIINNTLLVYDPLIRLFYFYFKEPWSTCSSLLLNQDFVACTYCSCRTQSNRYVPRTIQI